MSGGALSPASRQAALDRIAAGEQFDVAVVGGGITGVGIALDAASRGLSVALVEAGDIAGGTSSRSSKLIHGGLRYLEMLHFGLVREALSERRLLRIRIAPHLVRPVSLLFPIRHRIWERPYLGSGLLLYDAMGGARHLPRARHLSKRAALASAPALRPERDGLPHDVRLRDARRGVPGRSLRRSPMRLHMRSRNGRRSGARGGQHGDDRNERCSAHRASICRPPSFRLRPARRYP